MNRNREDRGETKRIDQSRPGKGFLDTVIDMQSAAGKLASEEVFRM